MLHHKERTVEKKLTGLNGMTPRAFRGKNMTAALAAVEKALGNEALIVSVHPAPPEPVWHVWKPRGVEVVAMPSAVASRSDELGASGSAKELEPAPVSSDGDPVASSSRSAQISARGISGTPARGFNAANPAIAEPAQDALDIASPLFHFRERLRAQGVDERWIGEMLQSIHERSNLRALEDASLALELMRQELHANLLSDNGASLLHNRVIGIVGVSGSGKTSACAKIAAYAHKSLGKQVHWISTDTLRAGAIAKAQAFTAPLGIPLHLAYSTEALTAFLHWDSDSDLFLIDTSGCNPYRTEDLNDLAALFSAIPERHLLMTVPATAKESDLGDMYLAYADLNIGGLVITKMDETRSYGELFNFIHDSQLPIAFLTDGARMIGDLHPSEPSLLVNRLLDENPSNLPRR
jgi:flagellar biosynthesis protein FlhF